MNKYRNCKVKTADGLEFDSRKEYYEYLRLFQLQKDGKIKDLKCQVKYELIPKQKLDNPVVNNGRTTRTLSAVNYIADFVYTDLNGKVHVVDTKSPVTRTAVYQVKKKLLKSVYDIEIEEI